MRISSHLELKLKKYNINKKNTKALKNIKSSIISLKQWKLIHY